MLKVVQSKENQKENYQEAISFKSNPNYTFNTLWLQTYYSDLKYIFEEKLNLTLTENYIDFVYSHSDPYITQCLDKTEIQDIEVYVGEQHKLDFHEYNKIDIFNVYSDIKSYLDMRYIKEILNKCTFEMFYDWIISL